LTKKTKKSPYLLLINAEDPSQCTYLRNLKKKKKTTDLGTCPTLMETSNEFAPETRNFAGSFQKTGSVP
jgi:hypothetical protein